MDINDLFNRITEAFSQYQAEMVEQEQALQATPISLELSPMQKLKQWKSKWLQKRESMHSHAGAWERDMNKISRNGSDCRALILVPTLLRGNA